MVIDTTKNSEVARLVPVRRKMTPTDERAAILAEMDQLAEVVTSHWTGSRSAVEAVREGRRDL